MARTEELMDAFSTSSSQYGLSHYPTMNLVLLSDAFSAEPLGVSIGKYESSERELAKDLFKKVTSNDILLLDRGLGGREVYSELASQNLLFIHRAQTRGTCLHEVKRFLSGKKKTEIIILKISKHQFLNLRLVRGTDLKDGEPIVYVTNLLDKKHYRSNEIHDLYKSRWRVETNIGHLKNTLGLERIKSKSYNSVLQDIYAHFIVLTLAAQAQVTASKTLKLQSKKKSLSIKFILAVIADKARSLCQKDGLKIAWEKICEVVKKIIWKPQLGRNYPRYSRQPQNRWSQERAYLKKGLKRKNSR